MNPNAINPVSPQPELSGPSAQPLSPSTDNTSGAGAGSTWSGFTTRIAFPIARLIPQQVKDSFNLARDFTHQGVNKILNTRIASTLASLKKRLPGRPDLKQHLDFYKNTDNTPVKKRSSDSEDGSPVKRARYDNTTIATNSEATTSEQAPLTGEDNPHSNSEGMLQPKTAMDSETDTLHLPEEIAPQTEEITLNSLEQSLENETATIESDLPSTTASLNSEPRAEGDHQPDLLEIPVQTALQTENKTATTETGLPSTVASPDSEPMTEEDHQPGLLEIPVKTEPKTEDETASKETDLTSTVTRLDSEPMTEAGYQSSQPETEQPTTSSDSIPSDTTHEEVSEQLKNQTGATRKSKRSRTKKHTSD